MGAGGVSWRNKIAAPNESSTSISHQIFQIEFRTTTGTRTAGACWQSATKKFGSDTSVKMATTTEIKRLQRGISGKNTGKELIVQRSREIRGCLERSDLQASGVPVLSKGEEST